ncbi:Hypothetical protein CINCED_3A023707 [Cinara cedri]|uniref:LisH domain-containing protein n=1 Tax=Cinara cedri TaxID=506608 RepID=A0A5E4N3V6_9HEMI|nr:Hypothetical protein CINCED_3A023707 [Cinara cedri]
MEPLMPSEIARLVYGYLKENKNDDAAENFLKCSPYLTECYQMFKANRRFNLNVNGFKLLDILDLFGTMCSMINERTSEVYQSKTLIEKLQYLLDVNPLPIKKDKCTETELIMVDKFAGNDDEINTENKNKNIETNKSISEVLEIPSFNDMVSCNLSKIEEFDIVNNKTNINSEKSQSTQSSSCLPSTTQVIDNVTTPNFSIIKKNEPHTIEFNEQNCSTPAKPIEETINSIKPTIQFSPIDIHNQFAHNQSKSQQIPQTTSLESMPGLSKDNDPKDNSVVIDTGELVDTFLNDKSLLEKIADTINKSMDAQKKVGDVDENSILNTTLEKALDSTQSDPHVKNILDEFLVFNVENRDDGKKKIINNQQNSIKSRLRSAKKKGQSNIDDIPSKSKKNNLNTVKHIHHSSNEDNVNIDKNILLIHDGNLKTSFFESYDLLSNQIILQPNNSSIGQSFHLNKEEDCLSKTNYVKITQKMASMLQTEEDCLNKTNYVKIAPKITPMLKTLQAPEKCIFPKRKRRLNEFDVVRSQFKKGNITFVQPPKESVQPTKSIIIEVPNQNSFETQNDSKKDTIKVPEVSNVSSIVKDTVLLDDTPDDRTKPPKNRSLSTPRRRSTHIRCLDFSTPQPKNNNRDQARSKLLFDTPKRYEKILEVPSASPLPKLQADWGSVNGFESIVKKETTTDWDTDIRNMVGAGILTSDADRSKMRKKKIPRKKIKSQNDKINSEFDEQNELQIDGTSKPKDSENLYDVNKQNCIGSLLDDKISSKDQSEFSIPLKISDEVTELCNEQLSTKSNSSKGLNGSTFLKPQNEFPISLKTLDKVTELHKEPLSIKSDSLKSFNKQLSIGSNFLNSVNDSNLLKIKSDFSISLETPDKVTELPTKSNSLDSFTEQLPIKSNFSNNFNDSNLLETRSEFPISLDTPDKVTELNKIKSPIKSDFINSLDDSNMLKTQNEFLISLETPDKVTELFKEKPPIESDSSMKSFNNEKPLEKIIEFPIISLETPDKVTELYQEQLLIKLDSSKSSYDKKSLEKQSNELSIPQNTSNKITELCHKQLDVVSDSLKSSYTIQNKLEQSQINVKEQENNLNKSKTLDEIDKATTTYNSKLVTAVNPSELTNKNQVKDPKCSETLNHFKYLKPSTNEQPENNSNESTENLKKQLLVDLNETNYSKKLNTPEEVIQNQPIEHNLVETPYKCDDAAVDVPETPISKLLREYDPSKLITPLHSTPYHYDDSTETPLTKVFRETAFLNRPPISPFPPTPGNSRSVDTLIVPLDQDCSKTSVNDKIHSLKEFPTQLSQTTNNNKPLVKKKKVKVKPSPSITKPKLSVKSKSKTDLKGKTIEAKISQVYESVKVELFGSEISSSLSVDELVNITEQPKQLSMNKKKEEKKSGFKPIPKRKSIQSASIGIGESHFLKELDPKINKSLTDEQNENNSIGKSKNILKTKQSNKSKKSMVHFDDPVEKSYFSSTNIVSSAPNTIVSNKIQKQNLTNEKSENLIGLSRYLNIPVKLTENNSKKILLKTIEPEKKNSKLKNFDSTIKYSKIANENSPEMSSDFINISKTHNNSNQQNKLSAICSIDRNKMSDKQDNITFNKSNTSMESISIDTRTSDKSNQPESTSISCNNSMNNISFISVIRSDELAPVTKVFDLTNNLEYLKKPKAFEISTDDSKQMVGYLNLSDFITLFSLQTSNNVLPSSNTITSPFVTKKIHEKEAGELEDDDNNFLPVTSTPKDTVKKIEDKQCKEKQSKISDVTHVKEAGKLEDNGDILISVTSTPKDVAVKKNENKLCRERRSPSFWENSVHVNYRNKYKDDRHKESYRWQKTNYRDRYDKKYWPSKLRHNDDRSQYDSNSRFHYASIKREFRDEERRSRDYRDYNIYDKRKGRDRIEDSKRILPNDTQIWPRSEDSFKKVLKRPADRSDHYKTPAKVSKVEHQRLLRNVDVDDFLSVVHGKK